MKQLIFTSFILLATLFGVKAQNTPAGQQPTVEVTGKAEREVVPDEIYVRVVLNQSDNKGKYTLAQLEKRFRNVLDEMKINIATNVFMENAGSNYGKVKWLSGSEPLTTKTYIVKLGSADEISTFINKLASNEISNVSIDKVEYSKRKELENELRIEAMKDAQSKASTLATAIGQSIGSAYFIQETNYFRAGNYYLARTTAVKAESADANPLPEVSFEKIKESAQVQVKFVLKEK